MPYSYLEHEADMGIRGEGSSWQEAFVEGAKAVFDLMIELEEIKPEKAVEIECQANDIEGLFVEWLNELIYKKDAVGFYFSKFEIDSIEEKNNQFILRGRAWGQKMDLTKLTLKTEVKGATYSGLKCEEKNGNYYCQCIVDI